MLDRSTRISLITGSDLAVGKPLSDRQACGKAQGPIFYNHEEQPGKQRRVRRRPQIKRYDDSAQINVQSRQKAGRIETNLLLMIKTEREGFEPSLKLPLNSISSAAPSTTRPSLQGLDRP